MRRVYKYELRVIGDTQTLVLPAEAKFVHARVDEMGDPISLWFEVLTEKPTESRHFEIYPTGGDIDDGRHLATVATVTGHLVWHIYEL